MINELTIFHLVILGKIQQITVLHREQVVNLWKHECCELWQCSMVRMSSNALMRL